MVLVGNHEVEGEEVVGQLVDGGQHVILIFGDDAKS